MDPTLALDLKLAQRGSRAVLKSLHGALKAAILDGRLQRGVRLPSTRALAQALGVSRNTAVAAYDLLASEGYVSAGGSAGTRVADLPRAAPRAARAAAAEPPRAQGVWAHVQPMPSAAPAVAPRFDFGTGVPELSSFPFDVYRRLHARALLAAARQRASYGAPEGLRSLREAIAGHVSSTRAVACDADDIVVTSGAQQAFDLLARILVAPGETTVAVEEPGYPPLRNAMLAAGARLAGVAVDAEGLRVDRLPRAARIVCVTPSHQFPLGLAMSAARRAALLAFATAHSTVVIEDDYDGEFRFASRPLDALQTLDTQGRVFYVGTLSKSMFPALRIGYVVAPRWSRPALLAAKQVADWHGNTLVQQTLASFIAEGHLLRHVRKMRAEYARRRDALLQALHRHARPLLQALPSIAGLHLSALADERVDVDRLVAQARQQGVAVESLRRYALGGDAPAGIAFGYGQIGCAQITEGVKRLARLMQRTA
jgi:GntR family transcriptional regulator/MocR family aminotransferase